jgi:flagellar protein FlaF
MSYPHNPYIKASSAYGETMKLDYSDQKSLEASVLLKAAQKLQNLSDRLADPAAEPSLEEIDDALTYNRKLWTIFISETMNESHPLPVEIKNNVARLSIFVFKRTTEIYATPTPQLLEPLVTINRQLASGLMQAVENGLKANPKPAATERSASLSSDV